jgi:general secretion pathway protein A
MYTEFYGLGEKPFSLTPDPRYLFLSASHREALAHVLYGIEQGEGFICVTGEVGTGKTTLC